MRGKKQKIHIPAAGFTDSTAGCLKYAGFHAKKGLNQSRPAHRLVEGDDGIIFPVLLLHARVNAMLELCLLPDEGIRDDKVKDQVRVLRAAHHAEVVQRQLRVNGADRFLHKGAHVVELSVVRHDGIIVDDKVHPQLPQGVALDIVEDVVAQQRVLAAVHLGMHAGEALPGP